MIKPPIKYIEDIHEKSCDSLNPKPWADSMITMPEKDVSRAAMMPVKICSGLKIFMIVRPAFYKKMMYENKFLVAYFSKRFDNHVTTAPAKRSRLKIILHHLPRLFKESKTAFTDLP